MDPSLVVSLLSLVFFSRTGAGLEVQCRPVEDIKLNVSVISPDSVLLTWELTSLQDLQLEAVFSCVGRRWYSVLPLNSKSDRILLEDLTPFSSYQVHLQLGNGSSHIKSETVHFSTSVLTELENTKLTDLTILVILLGVWCLVLSLFFKRWGKIRNLIPYQPYQPACLEEISHQLERRQSDRKTKVTSLEVCGRCRSPPSTGHRDTSLADLVVQVRRDGNKSHSTAALSSQSANKVTPQSQIQEMFERLDQEEDGEVYLREVVDYLAVIDNNIEQSHRVKLLLLEYKEEKDKVLDFKEFTMIMDQIKEAGWTRFKPVKGQPITDKDIKKVFRMVDMDKSGAISQLELKMGLKYLAKRYGIKDMKTWKEAVKEADSNNDGKLTFLEFQDAVKLAEQKMANQGPTE